MKLTIDTQVDTYEDIKKVLHILNGILERKDGGISSNFNVESYGNTSTGTSSSASGDTSNLMSMFGDDSSGSSAMSNSMEKKDNPPDFSSFLNLVNQNKDDKPKRSYSEDLGSVQVY